MFAVNLVLWTALGIVLDALFFLCFYCYSRNKKIQVSVENSNANILKIEGLRERKPKSGKNGSPTYALTVSKGKVCCLIGDKSALKTSLLEMIAGLKFCAPGATMTIQDEEFFMRGNRPDISDFLVYQSS